MANCIKNLFDLLGGTPDSGGTWTYECTDPVTVDIDGTPTTLNQGDTVGTSDSPLVCISDLGVGVFANCFCYTIENDGCDPSSSCLTITVVEAPCAGADASIDVCIGDAPFFLIDLLGSGPCGTATPTGNWTLISGDLSGLTLSMDDDGTNDSFNPSAGGVLAGTRVLEYEAISGAGTLDPDCDCESDTATLTINVFDNPDAGDDAEISICLIV
jgi:hypothetical protein